ncbi:hypothetical protein [Methylobacterium sp. WL19]|uniref:hypothetical protein n=1 Tax=Methylobacterium sp. WL19 TaxID=2603896 RepID=UPI0011CAE445|nr:hypothetical protein [Methylobacterium sp. WL19]TXN22075.1 hypothetical protein FV220_22380 [Methylobacterium sp. WL19]
MSGEVSDIEIRLAVVQFMRDMNMPAFRPDDCAKLLAKRLKLLAVSAAENADAKREGMASVEALATSLAADAYEHGMDATRHCGPFDVKSYGRGYADGMKATAERFTGLVAQAVEDGA